MTCSTRTYSYYVDKVLISTVLRVSTNVAACHFTRQLSHEMKLFVTEKKCLTAFIFLHLLILGFSAPAGSSSSSTPVGCPVVNSITPEVSPSRTSSGDLSMTDGTPGAGGGGGGAPPTHGDMEDLHESLTSLQEPRPEKNLRSTWLRKAR